MSVDGNENKVTLYIELDPPSAECLEQWLADGGMWSNTTLSPALLAGIRAGLRRYRARVRLAEIDAELQALQLERGIVYEQTYK